MNYYISTTEYNCGIDLHSRQMYVCVMDKQGNKLVHKNIRNNDFNHFLKIVADYRHDMTVVCESTFNWYWLADACFDADIEFVLAHALYLSHIHGGKNKNDRIDSEKLAHLLRTNLIPPAYVYPSEHRPVRALSRQRMNYVWECATLKTHLNMNQQSEGLTPAKKSGKNWDLWEERITDNYDNPLHKFAVSCDIELIRTYDTQIAKLEKEIIRQTKNNLGHDFNVLLSMTGIGKILAVTMLYEIDTIKRFPSVKDFLSYCRLVKGSVASAGQVKGLTGGKMGNAYLRWCFGQAAITAKRKDSPLGTYAAKLVEKRGKFKGNAILASKMARSAYFMLTNGTVFDVERIISTSI